MLSTFVRLTLIVALAIAVLFVVGIILKIVLVAAVIAAAVLGVLFLLNLVRRRRAGAPRYPAT